MKSQINRNRVLTFFTHLLVISMLFVLPEVLWSLAFPWKKVHPEFFIKAFTFITVFYVEYYLILRRLPSRSSQWGRFAATNIVLIAVVLTLFYLSGFAPSRPPKNPDHVSFISRTALMLTRDAVMIILTIGLAVAMKLGEQWRFLETRRRELADAQRADELANLKSQLNPHFLFNTLNSIYALIAITPDKAQSAVHELSRMLRYMLYESHATVPLEKEINFIRNYIELMKLRLSPSLPLEVTLDAGDCADTPVAPLIFITLIENVFKHGDTAAPFKPVTISLTAGRGVVHCVTSNAVAPRAATESGGIGLTNLNRRLSLLYGDRASLKTSVTDGRFVATLSIDLNTETDE
ncbi:MAG: histidine kinase [Bacteroidales bacterium]|nr:histidine kinase [Bacteroidales bacterium]MBD5253762.1 histidine kinase [Barnesiella sp.]